MRGDWTRLASYVKSQRVKVGYMWRSELSRVLDISDRTIGKLESGQSVSAGTLAAVESALGWAPGSCQRILEGGEPALAPPAEAPRQGERLDLASLPTEDLLRLTLETLAKLRDDLVARYGEQAGLTMFHAVADPHLAEVSRIIEGGEENGKAS